VQTLVVNAIDDFPVTDAGHVPYYSETSRNALAINAADPLLRDRFARAETTFTGVSGNYDLTIVGLAELDGEAEYRLLINNTVTGDAVNPEVSIDYTPIAHKFLSVTLNTGDTLAVESIANSNETIPEGDGFAYARGRWTELRITPDGEEDTQPNKVALSANVSLLNTTVTVNEAVVLDFAVINDDVGGATATNVQVQIDIPDAFEVSDLGACSAIPSLHTDSQSVACPLSELAPGSATSGQLELTAVTASNNSSVHVSAVSNETDVDGADNRASISVSVIMPGGEEIAPNPEPDVVVIRPEPGELENGPSAPGAMAESLGGLGTLSSQSSEPIMTGGALGFGTQFGLLLYLLTGRRRQVKHT